MPTPTLIFVKNGNRLMAVAVSAGQILEVIDGGIRGGNTDVNDQMTQLAWHLDKMTLESLKALFSALGLRVSALGATSGRKVVMKKANYISAIVQNWEQIRERAHFVADATSDQPSSSAMPPSSNNDTGNVGVFSGKAHRLGETPDLTSATITMNSRLEIEDVGGGYNPRDTDEWTEKDEKALQLLKGLNSGAVKLNPDELQMLEAKKEAWLKKQEAEISSDDEWANTTAREAENEVEEQDVLNPTDKFNDGADVRVVRVLRNSAMKRGYCVLMDVDDSTVEDFLIELEQFGIIDDKDDFHVLFNGRIVNPELGLRRFAENTKEKSTLTFTLKVATLKGGAKQKKKPVKKDKENVDRMVAKMKKHSKPLDDAEISYLADTLNRLTTEHHMEFDIPKMLDALPIGKLKDIQKLVDKNSESKVANLKIDAIAYEMLDYMAVLHENLETVSEVYDFMSEKFMVAYATRYNAIWGDSVRVSHAAFFDEISAIIAKKQEAHMKHLEDEVKKHQGMAGRGTDMDTTG